MANKKDYFQYMVDFDLPEQMDNSFMSLVPKQRECINELFVDQRLLSYTLSLDRQKLWATFLAENELEVIEMLENLPLTKYMSYKIHPLLFNELVKMGLPAISLN